MAPREAACGASSTLQLQVALQVAGPPWAGPSTACSKTRQAGQAADTDKEGCWKSVPKELACNMAPVNQLRDEELAWLLNHALRRPQ